MPKQRVYIRRKPRFYIRMNVDGRWHYLVKVLSHPQRPVWVDETELDKQTPKLYKTLVHARNSLDRYVSAVAQQSEVAVWKDEYANV